MKFRFKVLNVFIKVNVSFDLRLFQGTLKHLQTYRIKRNYRGWGATSLWIMSVTMVAWLRKIVNWNYLEIPLTFLGVSDISFHYKSAFKELFKANLSFRIFQLTERFGIKMRVFNFLMMKVYVWIVLGNFRVNRKLVFWLKCFCDFRWKVVESKFTCHFRFL